MTLNAGTVLNNRYRIAKLVGQGGFGAVYRAWDTSLSQPVALKENKTAGWSHSASSSARPSYWLGCATLTCRASSITSSYPTRGSTW